MTRDEYLISVCQLVRDIDRERVGIKASALGNLILRSLKEHWRVHGFSKLKDLLDELSKGRTIRVGSDPQGQFAVWSLAPPAISKSLVAPRQRLRTDVWVGFVNAHPPGLRFFNRVTGQISLGNAQVPDLKADWVAIPVIKEDQQKEWARALIVELQLDSMRECLGDPKWYLRLPAELRAVNPIYLSRWNAVRTSHVAEIVENWAQEHSVPRELILRVPPPPEKLPPIDTTESRAEPVRERVLAAISRMTTEQLLEIPIPAKYLLEVPYSATG